MVVCFRVKNLSSVGWVCVVGNGWLSCGIVHGAKNAMLMRGGACAAELRLMGLGVGFVCALGFLFDVWSLCICCLLLRAMVVWCFAFLALRLYALVVSLLFVCGGSVCVSDMGGPLYVVVVSLVCLVGAVDVCDVGASGIMVGAPGRSCCVFVVL